MNIEYPPIAVDSLLVDLGIHVKNWFRLPDGNWMYEWKAEGEVIIRLEIVGENKYKLIITYPDRPAKFFSITQE